MQGDFYLSSPAGAARPFHQLKLPCAISLANGRQKKNTSMQCEVTGLATTVVRV